MKITLSIDSKEYLEIDNSQLENIVLWLDDDNRYASFYAQLALHPSSDVRIEVANKESTPSEAIELLARDSSIEVVRCVANNDRALQRFDVSLIKEMINRDVSVAADIANNLSMVPENDLGELIEMLLQHADPKVVEATRVFESKLDSDIQYYE